MTYAFCRILQITIAIFIDRDNTIRVIDLIVDATDPGCEIATDTALPVNKTVMYSITASG